MLVQVRYPDSARESMFLKMKDGELIEVRVLRFVDRGGVEIGIDAPDDVRILREELARKEGWV